MSGTENKKASKKQIKGLFSSVKTQLPRMLIEVFVIIVSILLAFAIEAWWSEHKERKIEKEILSGILEDFLHNSDLLDANEKIHVQVFDASNILASMIGPDAELTVTNDSIGTLILDMQNHYTYDPMTGTLNALINSDITLIEDWELRKSLVSWLDLVEDMNEDELNQRYLVQEYLHPFLLEQMPFRSMYGTEKDDYPISNFQPNYEPLFTDRYFQNLVELKKRLASHVLAELDLVRKECEKIILITEQELKK
ncbi:MAG: hypothetical protein JRJ00_14685 [Deltaproteobacteria bacterium]|nr:hypothetical protein [Deltaproteobacteria bacterium]